MSYKPDAHEMSVMQRVGRVKFMRKSIEMYNKTCNDCKAKIMKDPKMSVDDYCETCKAMAKEVWGKYLE